MTRQDSSKEGPYTSTDLDLTVAGVGPLHFQSADAWGAWAIFPEQTRLGSFATEEEALTVARAYREQVIDTLRKSTRLKGICYFGWKPG